jgi:hypothetical protein
MEEKCAMRAGEGGGRVPGKMGLEIIAMLGLEGAARMRARVSDDGLLMDDQVTLHLYLGGECLSARGLGAGEGLLASMPTKMEEEIMPKEEGGGAARPVAGVRSHSAVGLLVMQQITLGRELHLALRPRAREGLLASMAALVFLEVLALIERLATAFKSAFESSLLEVAHSNVGREVTPGRCLVLASRPRAREGTLTRVTAHMDRQLTRSVGRISTSIVGTGVRADIKMAQLVVPKRARRGKQRAASRMGARVSGAL